MVHRARRMSDAFDIVVIGAGASGEAPADYAPLRGATVALIGKGMCGGIRALWAGPSGVEFAQYFARFGVRTTIVQSNERLNPTDHPRSSQVLADAFRAQGIDVRTGARASRVRPRGGKDGEHVIDLADGST